MSHEQIFDYVMSKYNIALGVDEVMHKVMNNLRVEQYMENR